MKKKIIFTLTYSSCHSDCYMLTNYSSWYISIYGGGVVSDESDSERRRSSMAQGGISGREAYDRRVSFVGGCLVSADEFSDENEEGMTVRELTGEGLPALQSPSTANHILAAYPFHLSSSKPIESFIVGKEASIAGL